MPPLSSRAAERNESFVLRLARECGESPESTSVEIQERPEQLNHFRYGGIAQLGERLLCKQEVNGSIPFISTMQPDAARTARREEKSGRQLENWLRKGKSAAAESRELGRLPRDGTDCDRGYVAKGTGSLEAGDMGL